MTGQERDYEAVLSRVLHTTTDQLEPVGDGLTKIRAQLSEPWLKRQWWLLRSEFIVLRWLAVVRCESFFSTLRSRFSTLRSRSAPADSAADPLAPLIACASPDTDKGLEERGGRLRSLRGITVWASGKRSHRSVGPAMAWLRPALAVAGAVVLVVAGVFALGQIRAGLFLGLANDTGTSTSNSNNGNGPGSTQGGASALRGSNAPTLGDSSAPKPSASAARGGTLPSPGSCTSPSTPPINSPSPSPSPTSASPSPTATSASPSPTATSPSPTPSTSNAPFTSGVAPQTVAPQTKEAIGTTALVVCEPTAPASPSNQAPSGP